MKVLLLRKPGRKPQGSLAEFGPALMVFFMIGVFPMLNFMGQAMGGATVSMIANQSAQAAANSSSYSQALVSMQTRANALLGTGFAKFAKLSPAGGYQGCGADLYVVQTAFGSNGNAITSYGPNAGPPSVDPSKYVYEYQVRAIYTATPFINMSGIPFVGAIPGVGAPSTITWASHASVEYPEGLIGQGIGSGGSGGGSTGGGGGGGNPSGGNNGAGPPPPQGP